MSSAQQAFRDLSLMFSEISKTVTDTKLREKALEAYAAPIVEEAKRLAGPGGVMDNPTGDLRDAITSKIPDSVYDKNHIDIGWTESGWYGVKLEHGYNHYAKHKDRKFIKRPHLRPAYQAKKAEGLAAAIQVLKKALDPIK